MKTLFAIVIVLFSQASLAITLDFTVAGRSSGWIGPHKLAPNVEESSWQCSIQEPGQGCIVCAFGPDREKASETLNAVVETWNSDYQEQLQVGNVRAQFTLHHDAGLKYEACAPVGIPR